MKCLKISIYALNVLADSILSFTKSYNHSQPNCIRVPTYSTDLAVTKSVLTNA